MARTAGVRTMPDCETCRFRQRCFQSVMGRKPFVRKECNEPLDPYKASDEYWEAQGFQAWRFATPSV